MQQSDDLELIACALRDLVAAQHAQHADYALQQQQLQRQQQQQQLGSGRGSSSNAAAAHSSSSAAAAPHVHVPPPPIITRSYFRRYMRARLCPSVRLSRSQLDYLFEQFDKDKVPWTGHSNK